MNGIPYYSQPDSVPLYSKFLGDAGLLTISRFKITNKKFMPFEKTQNWDVLSKKGCLYSCI